MSFCLTDLSYHASQELASSAGVESHDARKNSSDFDFTGIASSEGSSELRLSNRGLALEDSTDVEASVGLVHAGAGGAKLASVGYATSAVSGANSNGKCSSPCVTNASSSTFASAFRRPGLPNQYNRRGSLQLWQFLVTLLDDPQNQNYIQWTGRGLEFKLNEPEEVSTI